MGSLPPRIVQVPEGDSEAGWDGPGGFLGETGLRCVLKDGQTWVDKERLPEGHREGKVKEKFGGRGAFSVRPGGSVWSPAFFQAHYEVGHLIVGPSLR